MSRHLLPAAALLAALVLLPTCSPPATQDRAGHMLTMAGEEAAKIPITLDRFTRQLNIADTQLTTSRPADADKTLLLAQQTLESAKPDTFDDFHRIAGWTAISQLARRANDKPLALKSADAAQEALNDVKPVADRAQYVEFLAQELDALRGHAAAAELLNSGAAWAAALPDADLRRFALITFANHLIDLEAYENARTALAHDPDPAWRTDTMIQLASANTYWAAPSPSASNPMAVRAAGASGGAGGAGGFRGGAPESLNRSPQSPSLSKTATYNKDVRFENVFKSP